MSAADLVLATADVVAAQMIYRVVQNCLQLLLPTALVLEQNKVCMHDVQTRKASFNWIAPRHITPEPSS